MPSAIRVTSGDKTFAARQLPAGVQFDIGVRERIALIGTRGSGKSAKLRCLCSFETLAADTYQVDVFERPLQYAGRLASNVRELCVRPAAQALHVKQNRGAFGWK